MLMAKRSGLPVGNKIIELSFSSWKLPCFANKGASYIMIEDLTLN